MSSLLVFLAVAGLLVVTPGPDMALVTRNALGRSRSIDDGRSSDWMADGPLVADQGRWFSNP